jgi:Fe-S oxidoreductase/nitrate reductase gamma subunit
MPQGLEILWYVLAVASTVVFLYGVARPIAKYLQGRREFLPARAELGRRLRSASRTLASHATIERRATLVGWAHRGIFYGFVVLFIGTVVLALNTDVTERLFGWRFFKGDFYLGYSVVLDVLGLLFVVGLVWMIVRRALLRPRRLDYTRPDRAPDDPQQDRRLYRRGDWLFVGGLLYLGITGYLLEGVRIAMESPGDNLANPVGWLTAQALVGLGAGGQSALRHALWWSHGLVAISLVAAIPFTKAQHMLTSYASLVLRDPQAGKRLRAIPEERAAEPAGYATLADFSLTHLLQLDACTRCGKCHEVCPANATGKPLSPRDVILDLREQANAAMSGTGIGGVLGTLMGSAQPRSRLDAPVIGEDRIREETVWSCMQCNACVEICPVGIEQAPIINQMRRHLVEEGRLDSNLQSTLQTIQKSGNSFGENKRRRGRWTQELEFEVKDARSEPVDVLWFVGDYASFDPRSQQVTRALARLYRAAGVDFGILYDGERNSGNDVRRVGEEGLFELLAEQNVATLAGCQFNRIVTSDPHSLNTLRNEYAELGGDWEVVHHTAFLAELIEEGRLDVEGRLSYRVTYHDPCYLGRHNGGYDAPRAILELLGCELVEMPRNRDNSFCCGAGGGRIWIPDAPGAERPSENRIREAVGLGELDYFVVSCPKDVTMYEDAIKTSGNADQLALREVTELIEEALAAAPTAGAAPSASTAG